MAQHMKVTDTSSAYYGAIGRVIGARKDPDTRTMAGEYSMTRLELFCDPMPGERWFLTSNLAKVPADVAAAHDAHWLNALERI